MTKRQKLSDPLALTVAANVRRFRKAAGLRQADLASRFGCDQSFIAQIEGCQRGTSPKTRERLARALGIEVRELWAPEPEAAATGVEAAATGVEGSHAATL